MFDYEFIKVFILNFYTMEKHCNESFGAALVNVRKPFKVVYILCVVFYAFVYIIAVFVWLI